MLCCIFVKHYTPLSDLTALCSLGDSQLYCGVKHKHLNLPKQHSVANSTLCTRDSWFQFMAFPLQSTAAFLMDASGDRDCRRAKIRTPRLLFFPECLYFCNTPGLRGFKEPSPSLSLSKKDQWKMREPKKYWKKTLLAHKADWTLVSVPYLNWSNIPPRLKEFHTIQDGRKVNLIVYSKKSKKN